MSLLQRLTPRSRSADAVASRGASPTPSRTFGAARRAATSATFDDLAPQSQFPIGAAAKRKRMPPALAHVAFSVAVAVADFLVILLAAKIAEWSYVVLFHMPFPPQVAGSVGSVAGAMFVLANAMRREYNVDTYLHIKGHASRTASLWALVILWLLAIGFVAKVSGQYSRGAMTIFFCLGAPMLIGARVAMVRLARRFAARPGALSRRLFVVGYADDIAAFRARFSGLPGAEIVGVFHLRRRGGAASDAEAAASTARALRPDDVFIVAPWSHQRTIDACAQAFRKLPVAIHLGPEPVLSRFSHARMSEVGCLPAVHLVRRPLSHGEHMLKRAVDFFGAGLGLILFAPLLAAVALLIVLDSPGGVFFTQRRYGFNQEPFRILKFRTMTTKDDGPVVVQAQRDDKRITRVGRWLRRFNIDELPQLVNVVRGDMSLVGPRPHATAHDESFERLIDCYARRHNMKPGITGWAQVNGFRGEIRSPDDILARVEHDLYYLDNWSIWLDFECMWRTVVSAKAYCNAY